MPLIASDGLEYKDLAARLKGEPTNCRRNRAVVKFRTYRYAEVSIKAFYQAFDEALLAHGKDCEEVLDAALQAARATGCFGPLNYATAATGGKKGEIAFFVAKPLDPHLRSIVRDAVFGPISR